MARIARLVVPGEAHHVTQRGNRRQPTFFNDDDYRAYIDLLYSSGDRFQVLQVLGTVYLTLDHRASAPYPRRMARIARLVVPGEAHHVTQRGNRRQPTFFNDDDYRAYSDLLAAACARTGVACWAYCLMPNHVHLILVPPLQALPATTDQPEGPAPADSLRACLGEAHRRYTRRVNFREGWRGHLWQERFHSFVMDAPYLLACAAYVERNPVKAGLAERAAAWPWSSAAAHLAGRDDGLCEAGPLLERAARWRGIGWSALLGEDADDDVLKRFRRHARTGRPLGEAAFVARLETETGRPLRPRRPGPPKQVDDGEKPERQGS